MLFLGEEDVLKAISYSELIPSLKEAFSKPINIPKRHHHDFPNPDHKDSTLLLMPSWQAGESLGVKIVTVSPENGKYGLPSINGLYLYFDAVTGQPLAAMDANALTKLRTAATSALASSFLSRKDSASMLMVGTGALAPELIKAHKFIRPGIAKIFVWGRNYNKAREICNRLEIDEIETEPINNIEDVLNSVDLISSATLSPYPLIRGSYLQSGQHIDLVGSYRPDMREADDAVLKRSSIFVDTLEGATTESGDLAIPLKENVIALADIKGELSDLCKGAKGRNNNREITLFKSVGHAIEDLVAARLVYNQFTNG